jgi:hypothetical protein
MTVSSTTNKVSYNGNGSTTVFAYTFKTFDQDDLTVIIRSAAGTETTKTLTTDYTVSGVGAGGGGNVTMLTAPAAGQTITVLREQPLQQGLDLVPNDPFPATSLEDALDKLTFMVQSHEEEIGRSIKASKTNTIISPEFTISAADRANKIFAFDSAGELSITQELGTYTGNWATATAYAQRDIVKDSSNLNIYICIVAHTSTGTTPITGNADVSKWALLVDAASATASAAAAASSATDAQTAQTAAEAAQTAAEAAETGAVASAAIATTKAGEAAASAAAALSSENAASSSASTASSQAAIATTQAGIATTEAGTATTQAGIATTQAALAAADASTATTQAGIATTQAGIATTKAADAATSASAALASQNAASTSEIAAQTAQAAAEAALDSFTDTYLGAFATDPTLDNDGNALTAGDLYFNTVVNKLKVYNGSAWLEAVVDTSGVVQQTGVTGSGILPAGTTGQRDGSPTAGYIRYNTSTNSFEGYGASWMPVGGGATGGGNDAIFVENDLVVTTNYTIPATKNAHTVGPISINSGISVTVSSGSRWLVS